MSEMVKKINIMVGYHGGQLQILPSLLKFTKIMRKQLIDNRLIWNKKDKTPPLCLLMHHHVRHVHNKKFNNVAQYTLRRMKVFIKVINKHAK